MEWKLYLNREEGETVDELAEYSAVFSYKNEEEAGRGGNRGVHSRF